MTKVELTKAIIQLLKDSGLEYSELREAWLAGRPEKEVKSDLQQWRESRKPLERKDKK